ncbi:ScyD/ScyE family protein [Patulibacter defluvii]|uniref:ScyD/ScyE family protein n=1 Tax=Patulibacter defluvii TaxID=3095358 RepID=UPI002A74BC59|nr:ScyD/ScyE family protein [Patulibacter sp. DM4]
MKRSTIMSIAGVAALALPAQALAAESVDVVARGIDNPRGLALAADGGLYVAAAGRSGGTCADKKKENCVGRTSRILRVDPATGAKKTVAKGLVSIGGHEGLFTVGANGVAVRGSKVYAAITSLETPKAIAQLPSFARAQVGRLFQVAPGKRKTLARVDRYEQQHNTDGVKKDVNSNPYAVLALKDRVLIADAGANAIIQLRKGKLSTFAVMPKNGKAQSVPTSLAQGPDGAVYVGELAEGAGPGAARVFRVSAKGGKPRVHATGFTTITGLGFGPDKSLFVTELATGPFDGPPSGLVVRVAPDGVRTNLGTGKLNFPTGLAVSSKGEVYVSNNSTLPASTPAESPFKGAGGEIVRITGY